MKLLIVDDEVLIRNGLRMMLKNSGMELEIFEAASGNEAVQMADNIRPDAILMDIKMPGMDGLTATRQIKQMLHDVQIIFLTAYDRFEYARDAIRCQVKDYLLKPVNPCELVAVLKDCASRSERDKQQLNYREEYEEYIHHQDCIDALESLDSAFYKKLNDRLNEEEFEMLIKEIKFTITADSQVKVCSDALKHRLAVDPPYSLAAIYHAVKQAGVDNKTAGLFYLRHARKIKNLNTSQEIMKWLDDSFRSAFNLVHNHKIRKTQHPINYAIDFMLQNYQEDLTLEYVARHICLSPTYFSAIFKKTTGLSFSQYLNRIRIEKSKEMLREEQCSVYEVAKAVGYRDENYFCRVFKKITGETPGGFRRSNSKLLGRDEKWININ